MSNIIEREPVMMLQYRRYRSGIEAMENDLNIDLKTDWKDESSHRMYIESLWEEFPYNQEPTFEEWLELDQAYKEMDKWAEKRADRERKLLNERKHIVISDHRKGHTNQYEFSFKWRSY